MNIQYPSAPRIASIDILRGLVMVIMALDHVRQYMGHTPFTPEDPSSTTLAWFFTRWATHFCAPVFVLLAGTSAFMYRHFSGCTAKKLSRFLLTRGLWIVLSEIFILNLVVQGLPYHFLILQVLWAIGWSMVFLSALVYLPRFWILAIGLTMIFGHNLFDGVPPESFGGLSWLWNVLHVKQALLLWGEFPLLIAYPLIPWIGVMAMGYVLGSLFVLSEINRNKSLIIIGLSCIVLFVGLRWTNLYGDMQSWQVQDRGAVFTLLSFLNTTKYPPSLLFLLMTIGPSLLLMPWMERWPDKIAGFFKVFGKVPFFYYMAHFVIIHLIAATWSLVNFGRTGWWFGPPSQYPESFQPNLWWIYGVWLFVVIALYPVCQRYVRFKGKNKSRWWVSYI